MTRKRDFKRLVRARMRKTGESYTIALAHLMRGVGRDRTGARGEFDQVFRLSFHAERAFRWAHEEADRDGTPLTPDHLLLGVLRVAGCAATTALLRLGIEPDVVRQHLQPANGSATEAMFRWPAVWEHAAGGLEGDDRHLGTGDLLRGLLMDDQGGAGRVLRGLGVTVSRAEAELEALPLEPGPPFPSSGSSLGRPGAVPLSWELDTPLEMAARRAVADGAPEIQVSHLVRELTRQQRLAMTALLLSGMEVAPALRPPDTILQLLDGIEAARQRHRAAMDARDSDATMRSAEAEEQLSAHLRVELRDWEARLRTWPAQP